MVRAEPDTGTRPTLEEAGRAYVAARKAHAETFLRYKAADPRRTDGVARAMADVEVDLVQAEVDWEIARGLLRYASMPWPGPYHFEVTTNAD